ncbi:MAG TPA: hypothetical protein VNI83_06020 [Vicinamibacterales bacterium]|nr:hypothetical protein [Vicinamibacterales bacterium]
MRCQRCGTPMELRDPLPGMPWRPDQFWVCPRCGRHFWTTYPQPPAWLTGGSAAGTPQKESPPAAEPSPAAGA